MKKINILDTMCIIVLIAIIATLIYAFHELYNYRTVDNSIATETTATTTTEATTKKANWSDEFEKSFRHSNAQYEEIAKDVNKNITTIEPVEHPNF